MRKDPVRHPRERGSVMVESSLVMVVFLTIFIGIADMGLFLFRHMSLVERLRSGLRYGVVTYDTTAIRNIVLYGETVPPEGATPSFELTPEMVAVNRLDANTIDDRVMITISNYPFQFFTPFIARRVTGKPIVGVLPMEVGNLP